MKSEKVHKVMGIHFHRQLKSPPEMSFKTTLQDTMLVDWKGMATQSMRTAKLPFARF